MRHAAITTALDVTGGDLRAVQRFSRHVNVQHLDHYDDNRQNLGGGACGLVEELGRGLGRRPRRKMARSGRGRPRRKLG